MMNFIDPLAALHRSQTGFTLRESGSESDRPAQVWVMRGTQLRSLFRSYRVESEFLMWLAPESLSDAVDDDHDLRHGAPIREVRMWAGGMSSDLATPGLEQLREFLNSHGASICSLEVPLFFDNDAEVYSRKLAQTLSRVSLRTLTFSISEEADDVSSATVESICNALCPVLSSQEELTNISLHVQSIPCEEVELVCRKLLRAAHTCTSLTIRNVGRAPMSAIYIVDLAEDRGLAHLEDPRIRRLSRLDISEFDEVQDLDSFLSESLLSGLYVAQLHGCHSGVPYPGIIRDCIVDLGDSSAAVHFESVCGPNPRALDLRIRGSKSSCTPEQIRNFGLNLAERGVEELYISVAYKFETKWIAELAAGLSASRSLLVVCMETYNMDFESMEGTFRALLAIPCLRVLQVGNLRGNVSKSLTNLLMQHESLEVVHFMGYQGVFLIPECVAERVASNRRRASQLLCLLLLHGFQLAVGGYLGLLDVYLVRLIVSFGDV